MRFLLPSSIWNLIFMEVVIHCHKQTKNTRTPIYPHSENVLWKFSRFSSFLFIQRRCRSRCCHHRQRNEIAGNLMGGGCVFVRETAVGDAVTIHTHTHTLITIYEIQIVTYNQSSHLSLWLPCRFVVWMRSAVKAKAYDDNQWIFRHNFEMEFDSGSRARRYGLRAHCTRHSKWIEWVLGCVGGSGYLLRTFIFFANCLFFDWFYFLVEFSAI